MQSLTDIHEAARTLRSKRERLNMSRAQLAELTGVSESAIKSWELRGERKTRWGQLPKLLAFLEQHEQDIASQQAAASEAVVHIDDDMQAVIVVLRRLPPAERQRVVDETLARAVEVRRRLNANGYDPHVANGE